MDPAEGKKTYTGPILSCVDGVLVMDTDDGEKKIRLTDIIKASLFAQEYKIDKKRKRSRKVKDGRK